MGGGLLVGVWKGVMMLVGGRGGGDGAGGSFGVCVEGGDDVGGDKWFVS